MTLRIHSLLESKCIVESTALKHCSLDANVDLRKKNDVHFKCSSKMTCWVEDVDKIYCFIWKSHQFNENNCELNQVVWCIWTWLRQILKFLEWYSFINVKIDCVFLLRYHCIWLKSHSIMIVKVIQKQCDY